ncbi:MAG: sua5/yciO/yrdC/ywlC family protein [Candidatus Aminicenantes bacterium]|nr:sua5/yciO/yrdC/ywlC family protein [Candidatus Aminicenantes bacterium]
MVMAKILKIIPERVRPEAIRAIADVLSKDGVIVYPTETFYGLGADCLSRKALRRIFEIKHRPRSKGLPVLVSDLEMAGRLAARLTPVFYTLASRFWPGPLTLVVKAASHLSPELVGPGRAIGIRLPAFVWLQALVRETGFALVTTSANISGQREIASAEEVKRVFARRVDLIVDGGQTPGNKPSTVIDLTGEKPVLVREGLIGMGALQEFLNPRARQAR